MIGNHVRRRAAWWIAPPALFALNFAMAARLFRVEYLAKMAFIDGQFAAMARHVAEHPGDLLWWPQWSCGLPWPNIYMPLLYMTMGFASLATGHSPALLYHQITAAAFCLGPVFVYLMALAMSRKPVQSFLAAAAYSVFSPCASIPVIRADLHSLWNLRRMQVLAFYGEGPHIAALALVPLAILFLYLALTRRKFAWRLLAGTLMAATVMTNSYGAVILAAGVTALAVTQAAGSFRRSLATILGISALAYCWISPLLPPSVLAAIRMNSPTIEGDYHFTGRSLAGVLILAAGFVLLWLASRKASPFLRFLLLFAWLLTGAVALGGLARMYVVPQPHRYQIAMDMSLCLLAVFGGAAMLRRVSPRALPWAAAVLSLALAIQTVHSVRYSHSQIRELNITNTTVYRMARWMDSNMHGARVMVGGEYSLYFNGFTDTPQVHGGNDPTLPNFTLRDATFAIYTGMNAGTHDGENAVLWLKALGAHAVSVPGPGSQEFYKPFVNPRKFDGLLPVLWREGDDTVYGVPARSDSLAHAMGPDDLVGHIPVSGLDLAEVRRFVAALDSPSYPAAPWRWTSQHSAEIRAELSPGQVVSTQVTWRPGWNATVGGVARPVSKDGLGFLVVRPACQGPCTIEVSFDGGAEWRITCLLSLAVMLLALGLAVREVRRPR
jgi:hypothetical protein